MNNINMANLASYKLDHIGFVVKDADQALEQYKRLGGVPVQSKVVTVTDFKLNGKPAERSKSIRRDVSLGGTKVELVQPVSEGSIQMNYLKSYGEGINHIGYEVDDVTAETAKLVAKGFSVVMEGKFVAGGGFSFFDTGVGNVLLELIQR